MVAGNDNSGNVTKELLFDQGREFDSYATFLRIHGNLLYRERKHKRARRV